MFGRKKVAAQEAAKPQSVGPDFHGGVKPQFGPPEHPAFETVIPEEHSGSPPLFVKIDKYTDIQTRLQELRSYAGNMRKILDNLAESNRKVQMGLSVSYNTLERINQTLQFLESKFVGRVLGMHEVSLPASQSLASPRPAPQPLDEEVKGYLKGITTQMEKIKSELDDMR